MGGYRLLDVQVGGLLSWTKLDKGGEGQKPDFACTSFMDKVNYADLNFQTPTTKSVTGFLLISQDFSVDFNVFILKIVYHRVTLSQNGYVVRARLLNALMAIRLMVCFTLRSSVEEGSKAKRFTTNTLKNVFVKEREKTVLHQSE